VGFQAEIKKNIRASWHGTGKNHDDWLVVSTNFKNWVQHGSTISKIWMMTNETKQNQLQLTSRLYSFHDKSRTIP
jgi:hypothetical protein